MIGVITGAFDVANFIGCSLMASFATKETQKFCFCSGAFISATCNALFGVMGYSIGGAPFISVCILTRLLTGAGASMVWSTGLPILVPIYPQWAGRITSLVECFVGLGFVVGPTIGSSLYLLGGYVLPFLASGGAEIALVILAVFILPSGNDSKQDKMNQETQNDYQEKKSEVVNEVEFNFRDYVRRPEVLLLSGPLIFMCSASGFLDIAIGRYLEQKFGVMGDTCGYYFIAYSCAYL